MKKVRSSHAAIIVLNWVNWSNKVFPCKYRQTELVIQEINGFSWKTITASFRSLLKLQTSHGRVTDDYRQVTDESQTTTNESQTSHRQLQMSRRQLKTNLRWMQLSHRLLQAKRTTEVYFQRLTWFNKFICRTSDICYYAIWFVYETPK